MLVDVPEHTVSVRLRHADLQLIRKEASVSHEKGERRLARDDGPVACQKAEQAVSVGPVTFENGLALVGQCFRNPVAKVHARAPQGQEGDDVQPVFDFAMDIAGKSSNVLSINVQQV